MTRPTETVDIAATPCGGITKQSFRCDSWSVERVHYFWVPDRSDEEVTVLAIQRGEASNGTNLLVAPVQLVYLNRVLQWFRWADPGRQESLVIGIDQGPLMVRVTKELPTDWLAKHTDDAYAAWIKKNPGAPTEAWLAYLENRVISGQITCECNECYTPAVPGTARCAEHKDL